MFGWARVSAGRGVTLTLETRDDVIRRERLSGLSARVRLQRYTITMFVQDAACVSAPLSIIDAVAVALIEFRLSAEAPYGLLYEPREHIRKTWIELSCIDALCDMVDDPGATQRSVTSGAIRVFAV